MDISDWIRFEFLAFFPAGCVNFGRHKTTQMRDVTYFRKVKFSQYRS